MRRPESLTETAIHHESQRRYANPHSMAAFASGCEYVLKELGYSK